MITPPLYFGLNSNLEFYSSDNQAGRAAIVVLAHRASFSAIQSFCSIMSTKHKVLQDCHTDIILLVPYGNPHFPQADTQGRPNTEIWSGIRIITYPENAITLPEYNHQYMTVYVVSRAQHVVYMDSSKYVQDNIDHILMVAHNLYVSSCEDLPVPALFSPLLLGKDFCNLLIEKFENSPHSAGTIASIGPDGSPILRMDDKKKHRSDFLLPASSKLAEVLTSLLAARCVPEIRKAFQFEPESIDRILIARYDETGGYFRRHRDNNAPQTEFRKFALSVNLNDDFEGGELFFPEYNDKLYKAEAGSGIIFSASALHEASPVKRGRRYCLLTFFA
ncbi:MAG: 2OG-Fe(II) oxygenase [Acetobacter papayae]|uniref:2OG-Fe(II) oxygenase family protein n=1 Tax=Acetobacter papayae TaxID=1076592 RepID=UPI0039ECE796